MRAPIIFCCFLYTLSLLIFSPIIYAQDFGIEWERNAGGSQWDQFNKILKTNEGNIICIGSSISNDFDLVDSHGLYDVIVRKYTSDGELIWSKNYGGSSYDNGRDIVEKADGSFILACRSKSADGDVSVNKGIYDVWIVNISSEGNILWEKSFGGTDNDEPASVIIKENGNCVVAASTASSNGDITNFHGGWPYPDYWLFEIDPLGNIIWQNCFGSISEEDCKSMIRNLNGGYLLTGYCTSNGGDVTGNHSSSFDMWVVSADSVGNLIWQRSLGGTNTDNGTSILVLRDSTIIANGYTFSFDGDVALNFGGQDAWLVNLDLDGNLLWSHTYGGSNHHGCYDVIQDSANNILLSGITSSVDGLVDSCHGAEDLWFFGVDTLGNLLFESNFGGSMVDDGYDLIEFETNTYVLSGLVFSNDIDITTNYGPPDAWLLKISLCEIVFYHDSDDDGYGNADSIIIACEAPIGFVMDSTDCNDTLATIYPGAIELCNYLDDDCDGLIDENLIYILSYQDADADNFGNPLFDSLSCELPNGYVENNTDCDDTNAAIYPDAEEVLNGIDDDCDQVIDEGLNITNLVYGFNIYPNPTQDFIYISNSLHLNASFSITNVQGDLVADKTPFNTSLFIDVQNYASGIYLLIIQTENGTFTHTCIKE